MATIVFVLVFLSARRFGVLALGLGTGYILSNLWSVQLATLLSQAGLALEANVDELLSMVILLFVPVVILLFGGPKCNKKLSRLISALMVAILSVLFLVKPMEKIVVMDGIIIPLYSQLAAYWPQAITVGLVLGLMDIVLMHASKKSD